MKNIIGVIGPNADACTKELYEFGEELGYELGKSGWIIVCGGMGGFMEAVCKGAKKASSPFPFQTIGILPTDTKQSANPYVDIAIPTGMGIARNILIIRTADLLIAAGGGSGTLSELAFAWQLGKPVLCCTIFEGWAKKLANQHLDKRHPTSLFIPVGSVKDIMEQIKRLSFGSY